MDELNKRLAEVEYILKKLDEEYINKIPQEVWNYITENKDKDHVFKYDDNKTLANQNLNIDTIAILTYINKEYLLDEQAKRELITLLKNDEIVNEQNKRKKYNPDELFKNKNNTPKEQVALVEVKFQKWYENLFSFIKNFLKK